eukprot:1927037-Pyramimonas_sp.AAC.1
MRKRQIPVYAVTEAVDLGLDTSAGRKRATTKAKQRAKRAKHRFAKIVRLRRTAALAKESKGLWMAGAVPQAVHGHQAFGFA